MAIDLTSTYACPTCPENCGDFVMPPFVSDDCPDGIELELSEIKELFMAEFDPADKTKPLGGPTDWTLQSAWDTSIDNTAASKVRRLYGIGDIGEPESTTITIHDGKTKVINRTYTLNFDIQNIKQTNYEAMRAFQCGGSIRVWFMSRGNYLYGGQNGIPATIENVTSPFERGNEAYKQIKFKITFKAKCDPDRTPSPWGEVAP